MSRPSSAHVRSLMSQAGLLAGSAPRGFSAADDALVRRMRDRERPAPWQAVAQALGKSIPDTRHQYDPAYRKACMEMGQAAARNGRATENAQ